MQTPEEFLEANGFVSSQLDRTALISTFLKEMEAGLKGAPSSLAMIPTYVSPAGELKRDTPVAVLDAGGTNLRGGTVSFPSGSTEAKIEHLEKGAMPGTSAYVAPDDFYGTFAAHLERTKPFAADPAVGFCFSYACEAAPDGDAKLLHWTKQIQAPEIVGQWIGAELKKRLSFKPSKLLVLNDTVTTLLAGKACEKPGQRFSAYIGFFLGTGTNVAYVQKTDGIAKLAPGEYPADMIINSESGGFDKIAQSKFDAAMDAKSLDKGSQVFEKMISGAYLGRLGLVVLQTAAREGLFSAPAAKAILAMQDLANKDFDDFVANPFLAGTAFDAVPLDDDDRRRIVELGTPIFRRAARLTAINIAAAVLRCGEGHDPLHPVCVTIDGSTFYKTRSAQFKSRIEAELRAILEPRGLHYDLISVDDAPVIGAAVAGLVRGS